MATQSGRWLSYLPLISLIPAPLWQVISLSLELHKLVRDPREPVSHPHPTPRTLLSCFGYIKALPCVSSDSLTGRLRGASETGWGLPLSPISQIKN